MTIVAIYVAIALALVGLLYAVRYFYCDDAFGADPHDLNRPDE